MPHHEAPAPGHEPPAGLRGAPDAELAAILPAITGPSGQFRHRQHINLAFLAVRRYGMPEATTRICDWIQRIAAYERAPQKYHHTVSRAWMEIVAHHVDADPACTDFDTFAGRHPALLDKRLLSQALPVIDPGRRPSTTRLGRARPPAVPLVARSGEQARLINHPPPAVVRQRRARWARASTLWPMTVICSKAGGWAIIPRGHAGLSEYGQCRKGVARAVLDFLLAHISGW